jgi:prepilin-type N-terminal cleavage/methylation domain-containing protein
MRRKVLGFTLIELMIVVAIIAIIAAIAIPGLLRARMSANEGNASGSLRSLASSQAEFKNGTKVDQNNNGTGEYGIFNELAGATNLRGRQGGQAELARLNPPSINQSLSANAQNFASKAGYNLQIFLPGPVGAIVTDNGTQVQAFLDDTVAAEADAIVGQENRWLSYAWPSSYRTSGVRAFCVDQSGEVYASSNTDPNGNGYLFGNAVGNMPVYDTAMSTLTAAPTETDWQPISVKDNVNATDTNHTWLPTGT